ncbi:replication fork protection component swi3 [Diplodia corticola]|uniref:Chromosome segregation in meiosis protein n=1 Tax=Diplodia corticola TaxID=236234 RepID=A0A1J9RGU6_9PEZI|nr:replication fork protection component swi3 [Diplodia corticola]OJD39816.1 replication fork protection component swi3 [Diplodia corticola]
MTSPAAQPRSAPVADDDLDDLFNYDASMDDIFNEVDSNSNRPSDDRAGKASKQNTETLGIDEEVTVAKKRQPIAKLDEARLLSGAGIPRLRRISKEKLRFKGKGHEFSDVARLLNMYQLWLDDLYPRAKFADGLAIIEKLGHKKRMQIMRREWINEGNPKRSGEVGTELQGEREAENTTKTAGTTQDGEHQEREPRSDGEQHQPMEAQTTHTDAAPSRFDGEPDDDELDALLMADMPAPTGLHAPSSQTADEPAEDELDALLAEEMNGAPGSAPTGGSRPGPASGYRKSPREANQDDEFADEMEAMEGLEDW